MGRGYMELTGYAERRRRNCRQKRRPMWNARLWQFAHLVLIGLALPASGCQKDSEAIFVSIALHPTNLNIPMSRRTTRCTKRATVAKPGRISQLQRQTSDDRGHPQLPATVYAGTMGDAVYESRRRAALAAA